MSLELVTDEREPGDTPDDILWTLQQVLIQLESMASTLMTACMRLLEIDVEAVE